MMNASMKIADGEADAHHRQRSLVADREGAEDRDHDDRRRRHHAPGHGQPVAHRVVRVARVDPFLVHARDEEDLVVHRQAEHDGEDHDRQERLDRPGRVAEQAREVAVLEDQRHDAERARDRQQVEDAGLDRDQQRAEDDREQQQRQPDHDADEQRQLVADRLGEVEVASRSCRRSTRARRSRLAIGGRVSSRAVPDDLVGALVLRRRRRVGDHRRGVAAPR